MAIGRALFLVPEAPYPTHGGGALRSASLLEYLAGRYDVDVIVFREPGAPDPAPLFPTGVARDVHVLELPHHRKDPVSRAARNAGRLLRGIPPLVDRFAGFAANIEAFVRGRRYEVAVAEHFWCALYHTQMAPVSQRTVLDLHNIESVLHARCAQSGNGPEAMAHRAFHEAARDLESFSKSYPDFAYAHYYAGLAYNGMKRPDKMLTHFEMFVKMKPDAPEARKVRSVLRTGQ